MVEVTLNGDGEKMKEFRNLIIDELKKAGEKKLAEFLSSTRKKVFLDRVNKQVFVWIYAIN